MRRGRPSCSSASPRRCAVMGVDASRDRQGRRAPSRTPDRPAAHRFGAATSPEIQGLAACMPLREFVSPSPRLLAARRARARALRRLVRDLPALRGGHLDEETGLWVVGTFRTAAQRLPAIAEMGFDVVYLTPIHPIGTTARKGRNNSLAAAARRPRIALRHRLARRRPRRDPPRPGHLRGLRLLRRRGAPQRARGRARHRAAGLPRPPLGPDATPSLSRPAPTARSPTPRTRRRSTRTSTRSTSTTTRREAYAEVRRVIQVWLDHGVRIFRVDNPHTKPVPSGSG